jgi:hypothetical protein
MAAVERIERGYLGTLLRLTLLATLLHGSPGLEVSGRQSWLGNSGRADGWISCLTAAKVP